MQSRTYFTLVVGLIALLSQPVPAAQPARPLKGLLITGGCCHDYTAQKSILAEGIAARANVEWTVVQDPSTGTTGRPPVYAGKNWSKGYDVVVHNECFADEKDTAWLEGIVSEHRKGVPAVVIHCAMHCYRAPTNEWFKFVGVTSHRHGSHFAYTLKNVAPEHPVMKGFPTEWQTPKEELYHIAQVWPGTVSLGTGYSPETKKDETCVWVSQYGKARVFGTTVGHYNHTMQEPVYLDLVTRGVLWSCDKLGADGKPKKGYGPGGL
ncbi:MAG: ThuA domain-containing protein [Verrucomicrobiales bacterium]|nr:ThuA domain-containing protein [Verrucomicrobiales bacterium]